MYNHMSLISLNTLSFQQTNELGMKTIDYKQSVGTYINKRTILCPTPSLEESIALRLRGGRRTALEPLRWDVKVWL